MSTSEFRRGARASAIAVAVMIGGVLLTIFAAFKLIDHDHFVIAAFVAVFGATTSVLAGFFALGVIYDFHPRPPRRRAP